MLADTDRACLVVVWVFCVASLEDGKGREQEWVGGWAGTAERWEKIQQMPEDKRRERNRIQKRLSDCCQGHPDVSGRQAFVFKILDLLF